MSDRLPDDVVQARITNARDQALAAIDDPDSEWGWWWLSFADPARPEGDQFLGALVIDAPTEMAAVMRSHQLGLNPGGEVAIVGPVPEAVVVDCVPEDHRRRLLTRAEAEAL